MLIATYNIQWGLGRDRRIDLTRIAAAVAAADVIALQEVERNWRDQAFPDQALRLAKLLPDHDWVYAAAVDLHAAPGRRRQIGNMILSRTPIESTRTLPLPSRPVAGFVNDQQALCEAVVGDMRVYNTHLNYIDEDQRQIRAAGFSDALELAGLGPRDGVTFPGSTPPLRLDHIFLGPQLVPRFRRAWIDDAAEGSDHQPVWLELA